MKITIFRTSDYSNTRKLADLFCKLSKERHNEVYELCFHKDMEHCYGCKACITLDRCVQKDSINIGLIKDSDVIVIVSPIYFFSLSSRAELFLDRLYSVDLSGKHLVFILPHGSEGLYSGVNVLQNRFSLISSYCGCECHYYDKVTFDKELRISRRDEEGISSILNDIEVSKSETC